MRRGDLVTVAMQGDFGKPRPALAIQADQFAGHSTLTILPLTSELVEAPLLRIPLSPDLANGLTKPSQIMIDKAMTLRIERVSPPIGRVDGETMLRVERCLAVFLGLAA
jgi:mRNA interferase MazF